MTPEEQIVEAALEAGVKAQEAELGKLTLEEYAAAKETTRLLLIAGLRKAASSDDEEPHRREAYGDLADRLEAKP